MRPKVIIGLVVVPTIIVLLAIGIKLKTEKPVASSSDVSPATVVDSNSSSIVDNSSFVNTTVQAPALSSQTVVTNELSPEEKQNQINNEIDRLNNAYVVRDAASKALIVSDLTNSDSEVRAAALEATKQLGDRSLIPVLQDLATNTADYEEHHALLAAAEFLSLPTMEEQTNWPPNPGAISASAAPPSPNHHRSRRFNSSTPNQPDNSPPPANDQPNAIPAAPTTGN